MVTFFFNKNNNNNKELEIVTKYNNDFIQVTRNENVIKWARRNSKMKYTEGTPQYRIEVLTDHDYGTPI